jgi:hypothetical protein
VAQMQTRAARPDRPEVDLRRLVAGFLRMAPDVAIVGEVRDRERFRTSLTLSKVEFDACPRDRQRREPTRDRRPRQGSGAYAGAKLPSTRRTGWHQLDRPGEGTARHRAGHVVLDGPAQSPKR